MRLFIVTVMAILLFLGSCLSVAHARKFKCSVCGSSEHGSIWHDTDKDGKPDR